MLVEFWDCWTVEYTVSADVYIELTACYNNLIDLFFFMSFVCKCHPKQVRSMALQAMCSAVNCLDPNARTVSYFKCMFVVNSLVYCHFIKAAITSFFCKILMWYAAVFWAFGQLFRRFYSSYCLCWKMHIQRMRSLCWECVWDFFIGFCRSNVIIHPLSVTRHSLLINC